MAVDSFDPTDGHPIFLDSAAPDVAVNTTKAGEYAADVGNRIVRANLAALNAYAYKRAGLAGAALDTGIDYFYNGSGWVPRLWDTGWIALPTLSSGWTAQSPDALEYRVLNGQLYLSGRLNGTTGAGQTPFASALPAGARPSREMIASLGTTNAVAQFVVVINTAGVITVFKASNAVSNLPLQSIPAMPVA